MKEFIDKLIGRLEELQKLNYEAYETAQWNNDKIMYINASNAYANAITEVNELAEEYNNDFCEWKMFKANARLRHKNCMFAEDTVDHWKFNFCPYCGKKIKIAPYQPKGE